MTNGLSRQPTGTLRLPPAEQWTLHHILLDRIEQEATADKPTGLDPPPLAVYNAFETLDTGRLTFTADELGAIQSVLAEYHHSTGKWELERSQIEHILHRIGEQMDQHHFPIHAD